MVKIGPQGYRRQSYKPDSVVQTGEIPPIRMMTIYLAVPAARAGTDLLRSTRNCPRWNIGAKAGHP